VTAILFACGCSGTASDSITAREVGTAWPYLTAWFPHPGLRGEAAGRLRDLFGDAELADPRLIETGWQESEDWLARWREGQQPFAVGRKLLVVPGEDEPDPVLCRGRQVLRITPGMAFGTGHHETTRFCLEQLEAWAGDGVDFLDVGPWLPCCSAAAGWWAPRSIPRQRWWPRPTSTGTGCPAGWACW